MTKLTNEQSDQNGLELALEATKDLIDGGVPLGEISARATKPIADLLESIERFAAGVGFDSYLVLLYRTLGGWAQSVEARLSESESARAQSRPSPLSQEARAARATLPLESLADALQEHVHSDVGRARPATSVRVPTAMDATTAALERAGEALAEQPVAPQPDACSRCGKPGKITGRMRLCDSCAASWRAPAIRGPLAQSPWVPGAAPDEANESHEHEPGTDAFTPLHSHRFKTVEIGAWRAQQERVRELEAEALRLDAAGRDLQDQIGAHAEALQRMRKVTPETAERSAAAELFVQRLFELAIGVEDGHDRGLAVGAHRLLSALSDCDGIIEFNVKEVLP